MPKRNKVEVKRCPYRMVFTLLCGKEPPDFVRGDPHKLSDDQFLQLQDWIGCNLNNLVAWSTSIGVIEAVQHMVQEAKNNANFDDYKDIEI